MKPHRTMLPAAPAALLALTLAAAPAAAQQGGPSDAALAAGLDSIFRDYASNGVPGCAVGVGRAGQPDLLRGYGMADLENRVPITPETVFEAGSVSKQFTAAATVLLALEGRLQLDDDVREHIPEVPDYGQTVTVRHLLDHTSGLRDWGSVAAIEGWPRGSRVHTHEHMLDIVGRQRALNYPPGRHYSYTNTGYNLQAVLVERLSGTPFAEFSRERIFRPLGLEHTQWRDDYTRVVPNRAEAYDPLPDGGFSVEMPFENVHGNGGLLTTVGDLLRWTRALQAGELGGQSFVDEMHRRGVLTDGRQISYASGLVVDEYRGVPEVSHSGATAGYRAWLARYPEQGAIVALLCNTAGASPGRLGRQVADAVLGDALAPEPADGDDGAGRGVRLSEGELAARAGVYRGSRGPDLLRLEVRDGALALARGPALIAESPTRFRAGSRLLLFDGADALLVREPGDTTRYAAMPDWTPTPAELDAFVGAYRSDEAEAVYRVERTGDGLALRPRFGEPVALTPVYPDAFTSRAGLVWFDRDAEGRVVEMHLGSGRVWDMPFRRQPAGPAAAGR